MRILDLDALPGRPVDAHGSRRFSVGAFAITAETHLVSCRLAAGGVVGRHPAVGRQLLFVLSGDASVSGDDGVPVEIGPGQAAVWESGEAHETRTVGGLLALVVEGDLDVGVPGAQIDPGDV